MAPFDGSLPHTTTGITLAGLIARIQTDDGLPAIRQRDLISAVRSFARLLELDLAHAAAGLAPHRARLRRFVPEAAGIGRKRWSNIRSELSSAFDRYGIQDRRPRGPRQLSPAWRALRERLAT